MIKSRHVLLPFTGWARFGFAARGLTYLIMSWFAWRAALGGGPPEDARSALIELFWQPLGPALLVLLALGFAGHGAWRTAQAVLDIERHGHDLRGWTLRAGQLAGAALAFSLGVFAATLVWSGPPRGGRTDVARDWTAWLLDQPAGQVLIAATGLAVLGTAAGQLWGAWSCSFRRNLPPGNEAVPLIEAFGRIGLAANAGVLALVGVFFVNTALWADNRESGGILTALETLWRHSYGPLLLGAAAIGLAAFGLFSLGLAMARRIDPEIILRRARGPDPRRPSR